MFFTPLSYRREFLDLVFFYSAMNSFNDFNVCNILSNNSNIALRSGDTNLFVSKFIPRTESEGGGAVVRVRVGVLPQMEQVFRGGEDSTCWVLTCKEVKAPRISSPCTNIRHI